MKLNFHAQLDTNTIKQIIETIEIANPPNNIIIPDHPENNESICSSVSGATFQLSTRSFHDVKILYPKIIANDPTINKTNNTIIVSLFII